MNKNPVITIKVKPWVGRFMKVVGFLIKRFGLEVVKKRPGVTLKKETVFGSCPGMKLIGTCGNCYWWNVLLANSLTATGDCRNESANMQTIADSLVTDGTFGCINWEKETKDPKQPDKTRG